MPRAKRIIKEEYKVFSERLCQLIEEKGITQNQLAEAIGKTRQTINGYTLGNTAPDSDTLIELSNYFDVSVDYLLGLSDVKTLDVQVKAICEYIGLSNEAVQLLHCINEDNSQQTKEFLYYTSKLLLNTRLQEMTINIRKYFEALQELEKITSKRNIVDNENDFDTSSEEFKKIARQNIVSFFEEKECEDTKDFYLFKISKNIQEAVKDLYRESGD